MDILYLAAKMRMLEYFLQRCRKDRTKKSLQSFKE